MTVNLGFRLLINDSGVTLAFNPLTIGKFMTLFGLLLYFPLLSGVVACLIGIGAIIKPELMSTNFGIKAVGAAKHFVVATGVRDVFMGLTVLLLFYFQSWMFVGLIHILIALVALSDFLIVFNYGERKAAVTHMLGALGAGAFGLWVVFFIA
ncbi:MAG: DUF4267 domain-containing protein [Bdellovibrionales bacterium]|nr:DUF4267 domain-containing protein [Bdellovibrionales bacterium]